MLEQTFKNINDVLRKEAACTTELDYTEQTSWLLFLKYLDELEEDRRLEAELRGKAYAPLLSEPYRWRVWAAPKGPDGKLDHNKAMAGPDLIEFINATLFPYLQKFKERAPSPDTIEYKSGEIFGENKNRFNSGYSLPDLLDLKHRSPSDAMRELGSVADIRDTFRGFPRQLYDPSDEGKDRR